MNLDKILDKVQKLLALSHNNPNPKEAATAAAKAQDLINKYNISRYALESATGHANDEVIYDGWNIGIFYENSGLEKSVWRGVLANGVAKINCSRVYYLESRDCSFEGGGQLKGMFIVPIGTRFDILAGKELFIYLRDEIERLCLRDSKGNDDNWQLQYKIGATHVIMERLESKHQESLKETHKELTEHYKTSGLEIVHVSNALIRINKKEQAVNEIYEQRNLKKAPVLSSDQNLDAYAKGRAAGREINLDEKKLSGERKALKG